MTSFNRKVASFKSTVPARVIDCVQVNVGKLCNQACHHCHVEAGPKRTEIMGPRVLERILELLADSPEVTTVDLTGGAPEMMPGFRDFVVELRRLNKRVIDRCNLTILFQPGYEGLVEFFAQEQVEIVASLPCYTKANLELQRGKGVFDLSIRGLQALNAVGYAKDPRLPLNLVYNPVDASLPPEATILQAKYKTELKELFDIDFNLLYVMTNMPINRYLTFLRRRNEEEGYLNLLEANFNQSSFNKIMCREMVSVGWEGDLFDCDFNQMLEMPIGKEKTTLWDIDSFKELTKFDVSFANHCYGCTAGAGSSCGGTLLAEK